MQTTHRTTPSPQSRKNTKSMQQTLGFPYPKDEQEALHQIWQSFKSNVLIISPAILEKQRSRAVYLMMQCHKLLKLPIQTLYLSVLFLDRVLNTSWRKGMRINDDQIEINVLGISCLYSCQKLEKIRNYGVSYWLKNISPQFLSAIDFPQISLTAEQIKRYEAYIMEATNYNLFSNTVFDILLAIWTLKPPNEQQFYFSQYFLQLSMLSQISLKVKDQSFMNSNTASSINQRIDFADFEDGEREWGYSGSTGCGTGAGNILGLELVIGVVGLALHFANGDNQGLQNIVKILWPQYIKEQNTKRYEQKLQRINELSNKIFEKALNIQKDKNCKTILLKYSKQVNMSISKYKFEPSNSVSRTKIAELKDEGRKSMPHCKIEESHKINVLCTNKIDASLNAVAL